jgi:hypothetical protein
MFDRIGCDIGNGYLHLPINKNANPSTLLIENSNLTLLNLLKKKE